MSEPIEVVKFTFRNEWKALTDALSGKYTAEDFSAAGDLVSYLSSQPACLVFASLAQKDDLVQLATLVKIAKKGAKDTVIKVVVVNFSGNKQFEKAVAKLGILDVIDPSINTKALRFKIDFYMKSLNGQVKNNSNKSAMNVKSIEQNKAQDSKKNDAANWQPPLECEDDIWLLKKDSDCKKVLGRWLMRFMGPGPAVCQWAEVKGKSNAWKLDFKGEHRSSFLNGEGTWYFQGDQKPDFVWKENTWLITGSSFELFYHENGVKITRAKLKDKVLEVCKNSDYAQTKESLIVESFNKELVFKKEAEALESKAEVEGDNGTDWLNNLEGKGNTEHLQIDPLEGKNDSSLDKIDGDPLSGKGGSADELGGHYEGEGSTSKLDNKGMEGPGGSDPTEGSLLDIENKNNRHKTHYKNHNEAEQFEASDDLLKSPTSKHRDGELLDMKNDKNEHKTHYKGHNEAEVFDKADPKKHQYKEENKGPNSGKTSTDHLPKFYNKDGSKPSRPLTPQEQAESDAYEGKGTTDKIKSHYGRGDKNTAGAEESTELDPKNKDNKPKSSKAQSSKEVAFDDASVSESFDDESSDDKIDSQSAKKNKSLAQDIDNSEVDDESQANSGKSKSKNPKSSAVADDDFAEDAEGEKATQRTRAKKNNEKDLFDDEEDLAGKGSTDKIAGHYKSGDRKKSPDESGEEVEDIFSRINREKKERKEAEDNSAEGLYAKKEKKPNNSSSDDSDLEPYGKSYKDKLPKRKVANDGDDSSAEEEEFEESTSSEDFLNGDKKDRSKSNTNHNENENVVPITKARDAKVKLAPLVPEKEIDQDLKSMMEEATITAFLKQNEVEISCVLDDFFEKTLIFIANQQGFNSHDPVKLDLKFKYMQRVTTLKFDGKILSIDFMDGTVSYLTIEIPENNAASFSAFMKLYQQRQDNIEAFLKRAKGQ